MAATDLERGQDLRSHSFLCELARGGMARVDLVVRRDGRFERVYALKRLLAEHARDEQFRAMFLDEARVAGLIRHANVVSVLDVGEDAEGPFLLMDFIDGISLVDFVRYWSRQDRLPPVQLCVQICSQIAKGLHAAHELIGPDGSPLGLVHRDVSPHNVLVGYDGVVRVTDFGIAKAVGQSSHTQTGVLKGKLGYMSPEQLRFEQPDRRSDLFSLGVVLYELLSSARLYRNKRDFEGPRRILNEPPPDIGEVRDDVPPALVELGLELLAKQREDRPATADAVARRLDEILDELVAEEGSLSLTDFLGLHFAERREEQRERLTSAQRAVSSSGPLPTSLDDDAVTVERRPPTRAPRRAAAAAIVVSLLVALGGYLAMATPPTVEPTAVADPTVTVRVDSKPQGAEVRIGESLRGRTPMTLTVPRSDSSVSVVIAHDGFETVTHDVSARANQALHVMLTPVASAVAPASAASSAHPPPVPKARHVEPRPVAPPKPAPVKVEPTAPPDDTGQRFRRFD